MCQECRPIVPTGAKCHSPAMRAIACCFFHAPGRRPAKGHNRAHKKSLKLPALVDRNALQIALSQVLDTISSSMLNPRSAGQLLYGLQIASDNFPRAGRPPQPFLLGLGQYLATPSHPICRFGLEFRSTAGGQGNDHYRQDR